jgi:hydroxyethylthiazole kinase-like uncharacterized protein yjeF
MRVLEHAALAALEISGFALMRRAAAAALASLRRHWPQAGRIAIFCGSGNNGGDGFLLGVLAREAGLMVDMIELGSDPHGDAALAREEWRRTGGEIRAWHAGLELPDAQVLVDALFGIGLNRAIEGTAAELVTWINHDGRPVLAIDVPSGLDADSGTCAGVAISAAVTVTFIAAKRGLHSGHAADHVGTIELAGLGVPDRVFAATPADASLLSAATLPRRSRYTNKGDNGHVLVIGGDHGMAGAIRLAGESALRTGAGLVSIATRTDHVTALNAGRPELMAHGVDGPQALHALLERASVLAVGPGLGHGAWGHALWLTALDSRQPLVLDADGLNLLAREPRRFDFPVVLTPHPGEAARLLQRSIPDIEKDRFAAVREIARRYRAVVVLKGSGSLVADPDGRLDVCPWGNPGMASGGMGDLLTGVIAALLGQGGTAWQAACMGVGLHARAGDLAAAAGERGLIASDLLQPLHALVNAIEDAAHA